MFNDMRNIFKTVIELAEKRRICEELEFKEEDILEITDDMLGSLEMGEEERTLHDYLNGLEFEEIKTLQTIMYLGRDRDYNRDVKPEQIYKEQRDYMNTLGWTDKWIEIDQMIGKTPLDQYLRNGLNILNINY